MTRYESNKKYRETHPWHRYYENAKQRCLNKNHKRYMYYGGKGIKLEITPYEIKQLWFRDNAKDMRKASIDRINPDGNYTFSNCRFIEFKENMKRRFKDVRN